LPADK
jgi:hypothetical protein